MLGFGVFKMKLRKLEILRFIANLIELGHQR
jgi:hypothetical protein